MDNIHIRRECANDYYAVEELNREAFWSRVWGDRQEICDEHLLVHKLRDVASFIPELDLVAEIDGKIVGHIMYSKSKVIDENGKEHEMLTFGPLAVLPEFQGYGIGKKLMLHSFEEARRLGFRAIIIFGHPDYYPRVGFRRAEEFGITTSDGKTFDPFMALELYPGALDGVRGKYYIDPVYEHMTQEEALEFDKRFPLKEAFKPVPIELLLNRLKPEAKEALESLNIKSLQAVTTKSERVLRALPGICDEAIEAIRAVMKDNGWSWGER